MIIEYLPAIALSYLLTGIAIALIEVCESRRLRDIFGGTLLISKKDLIYRVFLWLPLIALSLITGKNQQFSKIKL